MMQNRLQALQDSMEQLREELARSTPPKPQPGDVLVPLPSLTPIADAEQAAVEALQALETVEDLIGVLKADLIEAGKSAYIGLLLEQTAAAKELLTAMAPRKPDD